MKAVQQNSYKISVIVPCFNSAETIADCLNSIVRQDYRMFEVVVVDGLSTDDTVNIAENLLAEEAHSIISEKDDGIYDAINKGIDAASGDYLIVLGSDDAFYDNQVLSRIFGPEFVYSDIVYGDVIFKSTNSRYDGKFNILKLMGQNICHQAIFYHKSVYERLGVYNTKYKVLADYLFNIRCFESGSLTIRYVDEVIAIYNDMGYSSTAIDAAFWDDWPDNLRAFCSVDVLKNKQLIADLNQAVAERDEQIAKRDEQIVNLVRS